MGLTGVKQRFRVEDNGVICASWKDDKDWTEIYLKTEQKKMIDQAFMILATEDNGDLPSRLVIVVLKKRGIINRLEI